jgi:hypothetical protein
MHSVPFEVELHEATPAMEQHRSSSKILFVKQHVGLRTSSFPLAISSYQKYYSLLCMLCTWVVIAVVACNYSLHISRVHRAQCTNARQAYVSQHDRVLNQDSLM